MNVVTVIGARPQFIKAAPLSKELAAAGIKERVIHTGQHYDYRMSQIFFDELGIRAPDINLEVGSASHAKQTGDIMVRLERVLAEERPERIIVFGDTNSTLAAAITSAKLQIPLAHVEAGLRSFNRTMPEEHNRVLTDHCSNYLFCPTPTAVNNLKREGIMAGVHLVGDPMCDSIRLFAPAAANSSRVMSDLNLTSGRYILATVHRAYNTDVPANLDGIVRAMFESGETVVFPVHPRTRQQMEGLTKGMNGENPYSDVRVIEPVGYLDMLTLQQNARLILTDSGGVQKEAYMLGVPCVTLRPETEWLETVEAGWNVIAGSEKARILELIRAPIPSDRPRPPLFGDGYASRRIAAILN